MLQSTYGIYISQRKYALDVLKRFEMNESNSMLNPIVPSFKVCKDEDGAKVNPTFYKLVVGNLLYLTAT